GGSGTSQNSQQPYKRSLPHKASDWWKSSVTQTRFPHRFATGLKMRKELQRELIIVGASSGIGLSTLERFHKAGWRCSVFGVHQPNVDFELANFIEVDLSDRTGIESAEKALRGYLSRFGPPQAYVHNSGNGIACSISDASI